MSDLDQIESERKDSLAQERRRRLDAAHKFGMRILVWREPADEAALRRTGHIALPRVPIEISLVFESTGVSFGLYRGHTDMASLPVLVSR